MKQKIIEDCNNAIINIAKKNVFKETNGYTTSVCEITYNSILLHCLQNNDIFNEQQLSNINSYLNKVTYE